MPVQFPSTPQTSPGMQWAAQDFIQSALRILGISASGETPQAAEMNDSLSVLNQMVDAWNADKLMIFTVNRSVVVPATLKQAYTLGIGGDFNIARPARIENITILSLNNPSSPLELPLDILTDEEWAAIPLKNVSSALSTQVWDDGGFPYRTLSFFPIPNIQVNFVIYGWSPLTIFPDVTSAFTFPPGYLKAIRYNLAVDLATEFPGGTRDLGTIAAIAKEALSKIKAINLQPMKLLGDGALTGLNGGRYNWLTDSFGR